MYVTHETNRSSVSHDMRAMYHTATLLSDGILYEAIRHNDIYNRFALGLYLSVEDIASLELFCIPMHAAVNQHIVHLSG